MSTLIIEHLAASELPPQWAQRMKIRKGQKVTVRIDTEIARLLEETIDPGVAAISGLVVSDIEAEREYHGVMRHKHSPCFWSKRLARSHERSVRCVPICIGPNLAPR